MSCLLSCYFLLHQPKQTEWPYCQIDIAGTAQTDHHQCLRGSFNSIVIDVICLCACFPNFSACLLLLLNGKSSQPFGNVSILKWRESERDGGRHENETQENTYWDKDKVHLTGENAILPDETMG